MTTYTPTIGMEVHAELKTKTKMFCNSANAPHESEVNTHVCPVCMAHPGTLPVINKEAVRHVLKVGIALDGELATYTEFDRKNYFYPDIPKGYQISQYEYPLVKGGQLAGVAITRVHLEEDTARSLHDQGAGSIVDFNRAGVPLMELVTEPVIHDAKTAGDFARELQLLLKTLGVSDANMDRGEMRVEANISISSTETFGTKVEVKNLNSFKAVENAIAFEIKRQTALLENGEAVAQETRGWDENRDKTFSQRSKETSEEYRYFPDPDLPSLDMSQISEFSRSRLTENLSETPQNKRVKYENLGLTREQTNVIVSNVASALFFERIIPLLDENTDKLKAAANYITSDIQSILSEKRTLDIADETQFVSLIEMVSDGRITSRVAKDLLPEVLFTTCDPAAVARERNLLQENSEESLLPIVEQVISENATVVSDYQNGKEASLQYLIGQGMKVSKGSANPTMLKDLFLKKLR